MFCPQYFLYTCLVPRCTVLMLGPETAACHSFTARQRAAQGQCRPLAPPHPGAGAASTAVLATKSLLELQSRAGTLLSTRALESEWSKSLARIEPVLSWSQSFVGRNRGLAATSALLPTREFFEPELYWYQSFFGARAFFFEPEPCWGVGSFLGWKSASVPSPDSGLTVSV